MASATRLRDREFNGYLRRRIPHALDGTVTAVVEGYRSGTPAMREQLLQTVDRKAAGVLSAFGERMAAVAVRSRSADPLILGLTAAGIADPALADRRDNLRVLAALNDAAGRVGRSLVDLVNTVRADIPGSAYDEFLRFCGRSPRDKSLAAMGMGASGSGDNFSYVAHPTPM